MSQPTAFNIIFTGNIADGFELVEVKKKVGQLFKLDEQKVDNLFQGRPVTLKKNLDEAAAKKYKKILNQIGMVIQVSAPSPVQTSSSLSSPSASKPKSAPVASSSKELADRSASTPIADQSAPSQSTSSAPVDSSAFEKRLQQQQSQDNPLEHFPPSSEWVLDEPGALLSEAKPEPDIVLPPTDFSVAPQEGNLLRPEELPEPAEPPIDFSVLDSLSVNEAGEYLIPSAEKKAAPQPSIDVSHLSLDEAEGDLLHDDEKVLPVPANVDTSRIQLV